MRTLILCLVLAPASACLAAEKAWPGFPPDCWRGARMVHMADAYPWQKHVAFEVVELKAPTAVSIISPKTDYSRVESPNKGYFASLAGGRPSATIIIHAEKTHDIRMSISDLYGISDLKWVNEKLMFVRIWWGRIAGTDLIYDVEQEKIIYAESVNDEYIAYQQYAENCPKDGCTCIKKK